MAAEPTVYITLGESFMPIMEIYNNARQYWVIYFQKKTPNFEHNKEAQGNNNL